MNDAHFKTLLFEKTGPVATLTMNRPERMNGMTGLMVHEAREALTRVADDTEIRVLVLTGAGKAFCPGADLNVVVSSSENHESADDGSSPRDYHVSTLLHEMPAVTIAAINGACAGAALGWACACDFRFAAQSAKFNVAFLDVGVAGDMGGPWTLPRIVGAARARELYFMPAKFDAAEALRVGLVTRVFSDESFRAEIGTIVERLTAAAPLALRTMKSNFVEAERMDLRSYIDLETARHIPMFATHDTREAFAAKVQKRRPRFEGR